MLKGLMDENIITKLISLAYTDILDRFAYRRLSFVAVQHVVLF